MAEERNAELREKLGLTEE